MAVRPFRTAFLPCSLGALLALAAAPAPAGPGLQRVPLAGRTDPDGRAHIRCALRYGGLPVWGAEVILHGGRTEPVRWRGGAFPARLRPRLDRDRARRRLRAALGRAGAGAALSMPDLVLLPRYQDLGAAGAVNAAQVARVLAGCDLAWHIRADLPGPEAGAWDCFVDARTGVLLAKAPAWRAQAPTKGTGHTLYSGKVELDTTDTPDGHLLLDLTRGRGGRFGGNAVVDLEHRAPDGIHGHLCALPLGGGNSWGDGGAGLNLVPGAGTAAADAAYGLQRTWDFLRTVLGRDGLDGRGTAVWVAVHAYDPRDGRSDESHWDPALRGVVIADGSKDWPLTDLRSLGHELAHGLVQETAGLASLGEAGGLDEATADFFGAQLETWSAQGGGEAVGDRGTRWEVVRRGTGADGKPTARLVRSMARPSLDGRSPDRWTPRLKDLDPHLAAGPMNRALCFLSHGASKDPASPAHSELLPGGMAGIGNDRTLRIWYRALTTYLTPEATCLDARNAALRAAIDLYGSGSPPVVAVRQAFGAVGVGSAADAQDDFEAPTVTVAVRAEGGRLVLTAAARDNVAVQKVIFLVGERQVGECAGPPFELALDPAHLPAHGHAEVRAVALDLAGNPAVSAPVRPDKAAGQP